MSDRDVRKLAKIVADHSRQIKGLSGGPQAAYSSIEGGSMDAYDNDGKMRLRIGAQDDGTHAVKYVQGPPPPRPTAPVVSVDGPVVRVRWDGMLLGGRIPEDFSRIDVHFALASEDLEDAAAVRGNLATSAGNETVLAATSTGTYRVGLVAMSQSRARSEMSEVVDVEVELVNLKGALDAVVDNASGGQNHYSPTKPPGTDHDPDRDLWFDTTVDEDGLAHYTPHRWDETLQDWISLEDERVRAIQDAQDALESEVDSVRTSVDGKNRITQSVSTPPNQYDGSVGDRWERMSSMGSGGSLISNWRWNGDAWVSTIISDAVLGNVDAAKIGTGYLDAERIEAKSITADKILVGGGAELIPDAFLGEGNTVWGSPVAGPGSSNQAAEAAMPGRENGFKLTQNPAGTPRMSVYAPTILTAFRPPVEPGQKYHMIARVFATGAQGDLARISLQGYAYNASGSYISNQTAGTDLYDVPAGEWLTVGGSWTAPDNAYFTSPRLTLVYPSSATPNSTVFYVGSLSVKQQVGATLIEDGAITTDKIQAGAITAESGIIGSLDAGTITVGEMNGARIEAGTIDTPQLAFGAATGDVLSVDALNFKRAVGLDLSAPSIRVGDAMELTEDYGIRQFGPDGALNVSLPSDGSEAQFRGDLSAKTLTATGRMSIQGPGAVASGGVLELESGVVPPATPAGVSSYVERTVFPPVGDTYEPVGLAWADGHWWRALDNTILDAPDRIEKISPTGELVDSFEHLFIIHDGITIIGNEIFCLGRPERTAQSRRWVRVYDMAGNQKRQWEYTQYGTGAFKPGIGTDGTNVLIAQCWANGRVSWRRFNPSTGALVGQVDSQDELNSNIQSVQVGRFDFSEDTAVITTGRSSGAVETYTSGGGLIGFGGWYAGEKQRVVGTAWDGSKWHHMTTDGNLVAMSSTKYPNGSPSTDTDDWWAAVTWADGTHETPIGPARRFTFMRRTDLRITTGQAPEGVTHARVYLARKTTPPIRTDFHLIGETSVNDEQTVVVLPVGWSLRANPPASNSFAADTPGEIHSALGNFRVDGTGAGEWGPLAFHADGTMSGIPKVSSGSVWITPVANTPTKATVTLPVGRFTNPPMVVATPYTGAPYTRVRGVGILEATATSFDVYVHRTDTVETMIHWIAVGGE